MYPTILIDRDIIVEAHRLAREIVRRREAEAAAAAGAASRSRTSRVFQAVQNALAPRSWRLAA
jgi:hypothetical protein